MRTFGPFSDSVVVRKIAVMNDEAIPRCNATILAKLPYNFKFVLLPCLLPEDHTDDHEFEMIPGARYGETH